jgi:hypothetical protein
MTAGPSATAAAEAPAKARRRLPYKTWLRWAAFALCVGLFVHALATADLAAGWGRIASLGPLVLVMLLPFPVGLAIDCWAWQRLLAGLGRKVPLGVLIRVRLATEAVGSSTPAGAVWAEALAPILVVRRAAGVRVTDVVAASTARRWLVVRMHGAYVAGAAVLGFPALSAASRHVVGSDLIVVLVVAGAAALVLLAHGIEFAASRGRVAGRLSGLLSRSPRLRKWLEEREHHFTHADESFATLAADHRTTRASSVALLGLWLVEGTETFLILRLLGADLGLATVMSFDAALSVLRSAAVFAPAGIGVQDLGYLAVLEGYGVPPSNGVAAAFIVLKRMKEAVWILVGLVLLALDRRGNARPSAGAARGGVEPDVDGQRLRVER